MTHTTGQSLMLQFRTKVIVGFLAMSAMGVALWFAYNWYAVYQNKKTQVILAECIDEYQKAVGSSQSIWPEVALMNDLGYEQAQASSLKPYFLVIEAQALAHQGKIAEAIATLEQAEAKLSSNLPYKNYYLLTKALIQLDAQDASTKEQALFNLQELAHDNSNMFQDAALYFLAEYYSANNDFEKAQTERQLLVGGLDTVFKDSPWAAKVKEKFPSL